MTSFTMKDMRSYLSGNYLGKQDLQPNTDGSLEPIRVTIKNIVWEDLKSERGIERKPVMRFGDTSIKPWILGKAMIESVSEALDSKDPERWVGQGIEVYNDPNVVYGGKAIGGLRARAIQGQASTMPSPDADTPLMTFDDAIANCFDVGIKKNDLLIHLKAHGQDKWNGQVCTPLVRQLINATTKAQAADLDEDIPF